MRRSEYRRCSQGPTTGTSGVVLWSGEHVSAARRLLELPSSLTAKPQRELLGAAMDDAFRAAAKSLAADVEGWNGQVFEDAVRQCFIDQGYEVKEYRRYDGEGGDMDMVVSPPPSRHGLFLPAEIAVQVKWKQGVDKEDARAVKQIDRWAECKAAVPRSTLSVRRRASQSKRVTMRRRTMLC